MGTLAIAYGRLIEKYGTLGVRFDTYREFYECVRVQINLGKTPETCL